MSIHARERKELSTQDERGARCLSLCSRCFHHRTVCCAFRLACGCSFCEPNAEPGGERFCFALSPMHSAACSASLCVCPLSCCCVARRAPAAGWLTGQLGGSRRQAGEEREAEAARTMLHTPRQTRNRETREKEAIQRVQVGHSRAPSSLPLGRCGLAMQWRVRDPVSSARQACRRGQRDSREGERERKAMRAMGRAAQALCRVPAVAVSGAPSAACAHCASVLRA
jgi:hypothetical protein